MAGFAQRMYPDSGVDAAKIQGDGVSVKDPSSGQALVWDEYTKQWVPKEQTSTIYSTTAPSSPIEGMRWVDTTTLREYEYYSGAWVEVGAAPAVVPAASETVQGVVELATDAEVQTGTDMGRAVVPSALAAWWTWVKTQVQTFAENLTLNGTSNTAPNQTAASGSSIMTRDLVDARNISPAFILLRDDFISARATNPSTTTIGELSWNFAGTGASTSWQAGVSGQSFGVARITTGATSSNEAVLYIGQAANAGNRSYLNELDYTLIARISPVHVSNIEIRCGVVSAMNNFFAGVGAAAQYFRFESANDTYWTLATSNSASSVSVAATATAPVAGTFHDLKLRKSGSTLFLSVNGGSEVSLANSFAASIGSIAIAIKTTENASKSIDIDFFGFMAATASR